MKFFKTRGSRRNKRLIGKKADPQKQIIRGLAIMAVVLLVIIFFFGDHGVYQLIRLKAERKTTQETIDRLRAERIDLEAEKNRLETDLEYVERIARERYRMSRKGEKVFKVIPENSSRQ